VTESNANDRVVGQSEVVRFLFHSTSEAQGTIVKVNSEWRVYVFGATSCIALTACSRYFGDRGGPPFMASLTLAGVAYLFAIREFFATPTFEPCISRRIVIIGLVLAAVWHVAFLRLPAGADDDIHRYVWDGHLQRFGYNPYVVVPSDPAAQRLHTPETRNMNNSDLPSPYPPGAQLFFRAVTAIHESTFALKTAFVLCDLAIALVLLDLLRNSGRGTHVVLAFAWNPLLAIEVAGSGHVDIVGTLLLVISVAALVRRWRTIAALTLGLAIAVKFLPIVLLPLYWKRVRIRDAALAAAVVGVLCLPFIDHGRIPTGSLGAYVQGFRFNGPVFAALNRVAPPQLLAILAVLVGLAIATWLRSRQPEGSLEALVWPMAASLFCAPAVFPWYLLWLLPFLTSATTLLIIIWTVSIIAVYVQWHLRTITGVWGALPAWVMWLEYGCVAGAAAMIALRRFMRPTSPRDSTGLVP
jgi:alpha-1,6-mannosyltransferase